MTTVLLAGAGAVARRAARQLIETEGVERLLIADQAATRAREVVEAIGDGAEVVLWTVDRPIPDGVDAVAAAIGGEAERRVAERALEARVPFASAADDLETVRGLLDLDDAATEAGVTIAAGCGLAPGLADVLAAHAVAGLDAVDEIHVARSGRAGPACARSLEHAARGPAPEWRDGAWAQERAGSGRQLVWFPAPVGGKDCRRGRSGQAALLVDAFPRLKRVSHRLDGVPAAGRFGGLPNLSLMKLAARERPVRSDPDGEWGGVWVEVRGRRGRSEEVLVYGAVDRMPFAAGAILALSTAVLAGALPGAVAGAPVRPGAHGLASLVEPVPFLAELARRGVTAATFEGATF